MGGINKTFGNQANLQSSWKRSDEQHKRNVRLHSQRKACVRIQLAIFVWDWICGHWPRKSTLKMSRVVMFVWLRQLAQSYEKTACGVGVLKKNRVVVFMWPRQFAQSNEYTTCLVDVLFFPPRGGVPLGCYILL